MNKNLYPSSQSDVCLSGPMSPAVSLQSCWRQNTECTVSHCHTHTHTLQHTQHTMTFPFRRLPFSSPLPRSYLLTTTTGPDLFPKDLFLAMFPAPWKHILVSGAYPQRKGQT